MHAAHLHATCAATGRIPQVDTCDDANMGATPLFKSRLLAVAVPYQWIFALFTLSLPPVFILAAPAARQQHRCRLRLFFGGVLLYALLLLMLSLWVLHLNNEAIKYAVDTLTLGNITFWLGVGGNICVFIVQAIMQAQGICNYRQLRCIYAAIARLERDIHAHSRQQLQQQQQRHWDIHLRLAVRSGAWLLMSCGGFSILGYNLLTKALSPSNRVAISFFELLIQIKCAEYCVVVQLVEELLQLLYRQLLQLQHEIACCERRPLRLVLYAELQENQLLLARVWNLLNSVERYFGLPMLVLFLHNGFAITQHINWAYIQFENDDVMLRLYRFGNVAMLITNMLIPCWLSQRCLDVYDLFGTRLHNFRCHGTDLALCNRVQEYSLQLMHQKMIFTCAGFFDINLQHFGAMILALTTYIVILIQFKLQDSG